MLVHMAEAMGEVEVITLMHTQGSWMVGISLPDSTVVELATDCDALNVAL